MSFKLKLDRVLERFEELEKLLSSAVIEPQEFAKLSKEFSDLTSIAETISRLRQTQKEIASLEEILNDSNSDLKSLAEEDMFFQKERLQKLEKEIKTFLLPKDVDGERNVILEVRAGTGGEEASLFASNLLHMYQQYASYKGWRFELLGMNDTGLGGIKEASASITGKGAYARLKFESGVHRVQRVPETEANSRIHTSAATVAVLLEVEDLDIHIDEKDLQIDVYRASGAGGQHVNTTDSAVRITHSPTGLVVTQQDERSQHKNKAKALKVLRAKLYELEKQKRDAERAATRKSQVGSGDRSERIRTYNFHQGRVTDHRVNLTLYKIELVMEGEILDEIIDVLIAEDQAARLADEGGLI